MNLEIEITLGIVAACWMLVWQQCPSSISSSYRSELGARSNSLSWTEKSETKREIFDDYGGMKSGSHSQTIGRLYAWEKKLYEEVKAIDQILQSYEQKCVQLRIQDAKGSELRSAEKTRTTVRDLYTRIWVSLRAAESISVGFISIGTDALAAPLQLDKILEINGRLK